MQKNRRAAHNLIALVLMVIAVLLAVSETIISALIADRFMLDVTYAFVRDAELVTVALAVMIYLMLSPASFVLKAMAHAFAVIQIVSLIVNILLQVGLLSDKTGVFLAVIFITALIAIRNIAAAANFKANAKSVMGSVGVWLIYQRPTTAVTWALFALDSASGHYSVTDGENVWYFSRHTGILVKEPLSQEWLAGKMALRMKGDRSKLIQKFDTLIGTKFTVFTNCATTFRWV